MTACLFLFGCAPERGEVRKKPEAYAKKVTVQIPAGEKKVTPEAAAVPTPTPTPSPFEFPKHLQFTLFFVPHEKGDLAALLKVWGDNPELRPTVIFPPRYFDEMGRKTLLPEIKSLVESKKLEIGLSLDGEPMLPLLADLGLASSKEADWDFPFKWPEDVTTHVAKGRMYFQKRWGRNPAGFLPPFFALSPELVKTLELLRFRWVLASPKTDWGAGNFGSVEILIPPQVDWRPNEEGEIQKDLREYSKEVLEYPFAFVDAGQWPAPETEILFLKEMAKAVRGANLSRGVLSAEELSDSAPEVSPPLRPEYVFQIDYSPWVRADMQRLAWKAIAKARKVVDNYKNSGQADLKKLDAAMEEIYQAESGRFLLDLGDPRQKLTEGENNFLATLANVYRLSETQVPPNFNQWFSLGERKTSFSNAGDLAQPFFVGGLESLTWNDPAGDDFGDGNYTYPMGNYPKGAFDLKSFAVSWTEDEVNFSVSLADLVSGKDTAVMPLIDVYIDVNRLPGAGSTDPLPGRQSSVVAREAAWEYALSFNLSRGELYQPIPGQNPRRVSSFVPDLDLATKTVSVRLPKSVLRGRPDNWRFTVGVMGAETGSPGEDLKPIPVSVNARQKNFGGGAAGKKAPPYIDLLAPTPEDQTAALSPYRDGTLVTLPYVEPE